MVIVDDEKIVIDGLTSAIDWAEHQVEIVGTATDGSKALHLIEETKPHIVMVDIRMPGMNGLELIHKLKALSCDAVFIIISAYTQFDYAKRALELEAVDYLTKPIEIEEIINSVQRAIKKYEKSNDANSNSKEIEAYKIKLEDKYILHSILGHKINEHELDSRINSCMVIVCGLNFSEWPSDFKSQIEGFLFRLKDHFKNSIVVPYLYSIEDKLVVAFTSKHENNVSISIFKDIKEFSILLEREVGSLPVIGVGNAQSSLSTMQQSYSEALEAFTIGLYLNKSMTFYSDLEKLNYHVGSKVITMIDNYFNTKEIDLNNIPQLINKVLEYSMQKMLAPGCAKYLCFKLITNIYDYIQQEFNLNVETILGEKYEINNQLNQLKSIDDIRGWLLNKVNVLLDYMNNNQLSHKEKLIIDVKKYVNEKFNEDITLDEVAELFHISPAYLSNVFSKRFGITMFEFIIDKRIRTAKKLLQTTNYKISEISKQVGYSNQRYFNQVFKKHVGTSPGRYRSERSIKQNIEMKVEI
ncbi:response regulator transcription factor [Halalkalibacter alkalisediminis]|uniref:Response regulator n=1 Tax=Halalkalibacter alkalisediminis TaxID=935616 RepID=A0ABV6NEX5_9BACI|nr:response regulator [Halalkalibacter alkalisediminis]